MALMDATNVIGRMLIYFTENITGSEFLTYLSLVLLFLGIAQLFKLPLEITIPLVLPLLVVLAMEDASLFSILATGIIYLAIIIYKRFLSSN